VIGLTVIGKGESVRLPISVTAGLLWLMSASSVMAGWQTDLARALDTEPGSEQDKLVAAIVRAEPEFGELAAYIAGIEFPAVETGHLVLDSALCLDDVERPWVLYVPSAYEPGTPSPLLVRLHGGVGRADITENPLGYAEEDEWLPTAEQQGWLVLYPFGQDGATWWDRVGMGNIRNLIHTVKRRYNVDDDRVWMAGFSDGASAGFTWAMVEPNDFAAVVALNGHLGVGSLDGDLPLYAVNLANTPIYAVTTYDDELYPSRVMRPTIEMALRAGADIFYRELAGTHDFTYAAEELPRITAFLVRHPRDPFPAGVVWEAGLPEFGACRWLAIDSVTTDEPAPWHKDYNVGLVDSRVTIGFIQDDGFDGEGVKVSRVVDGSAAEAMGLKDGDIIIKGDGLSIANMDDLLEFKSRLERGDTFDLTLRRGEGTKVLAGSLPGPENYYIFKREMPSGLVRAGCYGNRIAIETSRVGALTILVHPDMLNLDEPVSITWNGRLVYDDRVTPDLDYAVRNFLKTRDRKTLYLRSISLRLPEE
jgi:poly(3-hydroxybutyrate) depolymerase